MTLKEKFQARYRGKLFRLLEPGRTAGIELTEADEKRIVDFLAYDSRVRKIGRRAEFESRREELKKLFEAMTEGPKTEGN